MIFQSIIYYWILINGGLPNVRLETIRKPKENRIDPNDVVVGK